MKKMFVLLLVVISLGAFFFLKDSEKDPISEMSENSDSKVSIDTDHDHDEEKTKKIPKSVKKSEALKAKKDPFKFDDKEEESFYQVQDQISKIYNKKNSEDELIKFFQKQGLEPQVSRQDDPYTGSMIMIRTKKALPGTRYYHAQYFTDEKGNTFLQHMSMEFRPGPGAMDRARKMIEHTYGVSGGEVARNGDFVKYSPDADRILWLKRMDERDLENEIFNSYDKEKDIGTIQATIELEIHESGREDADHIHPDQ